MEKKERRMEKVMGKPQRRNPLELESLRVQLQVKYQYLLCVFTGNSWPFFSNIVSYVLLNTEHSLFYPLPYP